MTTTDTVDDLQRALDLMPDDWFLREVIADSLADLGSELSAGYRALAKCKLNASDLYAVFDTGRIAWAVGKPVQWFKKHMVASIFRYWLPDDWFDLLETDRVYMSSWSDRYPNRRAAEDAAARAFLKLPESRQQQLLRGEL